MELVVEESMTTLSGEGNRPRSKNQSGLVSRRGNNDHVRMAPHQIKVTVATSRLSKARQHDFPQLRNSVQAVTAANRTNTLRGRSKRTKAGVFNTRLNQPGNAQLVRAWISRERGREKNNVNDRAKSGNFDLFHCAISVLAIGLHFCYIIFLVTSKSDGGLISMRSFSYR